MASSIHILDIKGQSLISRSFRGDINEDATKVFTHRVIDDDENITAPVFEDNGNTYCYIRHKDLYLLAVSRINAVPLQMITFLHKIVKVFTTYFKCVTEDAIRDNFVIIYELLDEMMDFGYPQTTEEMLLKQYITQQGLIPTIIEADHLKVKELPAGYTGAGGSVPWRKVGIKHKRNEAFLEVIENVNVLVDQSGETLSSEIIGCLKMRTRLTGMPELTLALSDKVTFENHKGGDDETGMPSRPRGRGANRTVDLEDVKFHQCVKLNKFEAERAITFIPPDGDFDLMQYRLTTKLRPLIHVTCALVRRGVSRVEMQLKAKAIFKKSSTATFVDIHIPVPFDADKPTASATAGSIKYLPENGTLLWSVKQFQGGKEYDCKCEYTLPSVRATDPSATSKRPISVNFEIQYFTASGFQAKYISVQEASGYQVTPYVRYLTQSGEYQIRTN